MELAELPRKGGSRDACLWGQAQQYINRKHDAYGIEEATRLRPREAFALSDPRLG